MFKTPLKNQCFFFNLMFIAHFLISVNLEIGNALTLYGGNSTRLRKFDEI